MTPTTRPHVLRVDGALRYDDELAATIDAGLLLEPGSAAETEELDYVRWFRGGAPAYEAVPRHRARNVFY